MPRTLRGGEIGILEQRLQCEHLAQVLDVAPRHREVAQRDAQRKPAGVAPGRRQVDLLDRRDQGAEEYRVRERIRRLIEARPVGIERFEGMPQARPIAGGSPSGARWRSRPVRDSRLKIRVATPLRRSLYSSSTSRAGDAFRISPRCLAMPSRTGPWSRKSSRAAKATARSIRTGSSMKRSVGIADAADEPPAKVRHPADVVDDREGRDVVEEPVDREVAAKGVLLGRAEGVVAADRRPCPALASRSGRLRLPFRARCADGAVCRRRRLHRHLAAERRDLYRLVAELDVRQPETPADDPAVPEDALHLVRVGPTCRCRSPSGGGRAAGPRTPPPTR